MKKILIPVILAALAVMALSSCNQEDTEYYVRYVGQYATWEAGPDKMVTYIVTTPDGTKEVRGGSDFYYVVGPVGRGFVAEIELQSPDWSRSSVAIYVARGKSKTYIKSAAGGGYAKYIVGEY